MVSCQRVTQLRPMVTHGARRLDPEARTLRTVAYDEDLAERIRGLLADRRDVSEQKMFGGLGFLVAGHMAIAASGEGGILVRADPAESDKLVATTPAEMAVMRGRPMAGWLRVSSADVATKRQLEKWVKVGAGYAGSLPPKGSGKAPAKVASQAPAKAAAKASAPPNAEALARRAGKAK